MFQWFMGLEGKRDVGMVEGNKKMDHSKIIHMIIFFASR
jgi:hypothetical protein